MARFNVCLAQRPGDRHGEALAELGELLALGLGDLGHQAIFVRGRLDPGARNVILGCHLVEPGLAAGLSGTIIVNTEPLASAAAPVVARVFAWADTASVWDYSDRNLALLAARGLQPRLLRLGWHQALQRIAPAPSADIDVLFYGSLNERRRAILAEIGETGLRVGHAFGVYGVRRDALIARAKLVLNMHFHDQQSFEVVRVHYLLNNAKAVVAEVNADTEIDPVWLPGLCAVEHRGLAEACRQLTADDRARQRLEAAALATIQAMPQASLLAPLLN